MPSGFAVAARTVIGWRERERQERERQDQARRIEVGAEVWLARRRSALAGMSVARDRLLTRIVLSGARRGA